MPKNNGKKSFKTKPRNTNRGGKREEDASEPWGKGKKGNNDVAWYTRYPKLVEATSSIIFNQRYGSDLTNIDLSTLTTPPYSVGAASNSIPGVILYNFRFLLAENGLDADAVNMCAKNLYTYIRHANSGAANYESSDMMQYVVSVLGVCVMLEQAKRDLRLVMTYHPLNRYVYQSILRSRGYTQHEIDDMVKNNAYYVGRINSLVAQLNTFKIPRDFALFDKFQWMVTNVFRDDNLEKASYYAYETHDVVHYDWANRNVTFTETAITTFDTYLDTIQNEISNLLAYEDIGIMIGDILKAYKAEGCRVWSPMQLGEVQDASYSEEVLLQLNNTVAYPIVGVLNVKQIATNSQLLGLYQGTSTTPGILKANIKTASFPDSKPLFNTDVTFNPELICFDDQPNSATVIVATRNTIGCVIKCPQNGPSYDLVAEISKYPTHIVTKISIGFFDRTNAYQVINTQSILGYASNDVSAQNVLLHTAFYLSHFPTLYRLFATGSNAIDYNIYAYGKNNLVVTNDWLGRLHTGCKMSEFSLPMFKLLETQ